MLCLCVYVCVCVRVRACLDMCDVCPSESSRVPGEMEELLGKVSYFYTVLCWGKPTTYRKTCRCQYTLRAHLFDFQRVGIGHSFLSAKKKLLLVLRLLTGVQFQYIN